MVKKLYDYCEKRDHLRSAIDDKKEKYKDLIYLPHLKYYICDVPYLHEILNYPKYAFLEVILRKKKRKSSSRNNIDMDTNNVLFNILLINKYLIHGNESTS
ncbi:hypothetical protein AK88_02088 [Plasmodium fragile]|uniref:Uncharacterized protein n=1 Tax=Plasmodium fragile TaxID=5857 RepID=A0A0D9QND5_PLAFR|nr:uncharacterized protein AK88_02088 [Plasmodium fragile]KJP88307.1 hypothetical protein AK88_02088 [Plasmodium fragile]